MAHQHSYFRVTASRQRFAWLAVAMAAFAVAGSSGPAAATACDDQPPVAGDLAIASPEQVGFDAPKLCRLLVRIRDGELNIHSVLVMRHGSIAAELYRGGSDRSIYSLWGSHTEFGPGDAHDMRSVSKSVVGLLYGILLARDAVPGLDTPVVSLYPDDSGLAQTSKRAIRVRDLLTMSTGLAWSEPSPVHRARWDDQFPLVIAGSIYRCVFDREVVATPGTQFVYSGGATSVIADIMTRATGRSLAELARTELFEPLGITQWSWTNDLRGRSLAYAGLRLTPRDLLKIGRLVLDRGVWQHRQVVPAAWIAEATATQVTASPSYGYGYQWWTSHLDWRGDRVAVIEAIGNGGQRLFVVPHLDLVVVMTAGDYNQVGIFAPEDRLFAEMIKTLAD